MWVVNRVENLENSRNIMLFKKELNSLSCFCVRSWIENVFEPLSIFTIHCWLWSNNEVLSLFVIRHDSKKSIFFLIRLYRELDCIFQRIHLRLWALSNIKEFIIASCYNFARFGIDIQPTSFNCLFVPYFVEAPAEKLKEEISPYFLSTIFLFARKSSIIILNVTYH